MRFIVKSGQAGQVRNAVQVIGALEGEEHPERLLPSSVARDRALVNLIRRSGLRGKPGEIALLPSGGVWVLVVGLGKAKELSLDRVRQMAGIAARGARARAHKALALPVIKHGALGRIDTVAQALTEGALLGLYRYDKFRKLPKSERSKRIDTITLIVERSGEVAGARQGSKRGEVIAEAVSLTRDLINGPSNVVTPIALANQAKALGKMRNITCRVISYAQLKRLGFGGIAGVSQGSSRPAQFVILDYKGPRTKKTFVFCGKGVTFDTGGISLKPSAKMEQMKYDMAGAAAVIGTIQAAATLKLPARIVGLIAATENMPSGSAQKPGDILRTLSGKTVEVINTDAEGRLILADCLHYAKRYKPDCVVDLATLTGACIVALGKEAIGLMTKDERLAARLNQAGKVTHERVWRLPLWDEYAEFLKSDIADIKNITGTGEAGTITAAKFLETFAEGLPWAHLDIAGTAWVEKPTPYMPVGAVGVGVRLLIELVESWK